MSGGARARYDVMVYASRLCIQLYVNKIAYIAVAVGRVRQSAP
jgi:hypothetical protein